MPLKTLVKLGAVSNLSDARYAAGMGVDLIGFSIDEDDPHFIGFDSIIAITSWLSGVKIVGETKKFDIDKINLAIETLGLDYVQLNGSFNFDKYPKINRPIIQKILCIDTNVLHLYAGKVAYLLFDNGEEDFDLLSIKEQLKVFGTVYPIIVSSGLTLANVNRIVTECEVTGIELKGGLEEKPGSKDFDDIAAFLEIIQEEE